MKAKIYSLIALCLVVFTLSTPVSAAAPIGKAKVENLSKEDAAKVEAIRRRVEEIKAMDKSDMSKTERKALKKELKEMKKKARALGGGVYLSVGAIIIIILLLILIL